MASYRIELKRPAEKSIRRLPTSVIVRIAAAIDALAEDPRSAGYSRMKGRKEQYRIRIGDYRLLYAVNDQKQEIVVFSIAHRRDAYRKR